MKKVLLKVGASALALTLMTGCGTTNDDGPVDDNPTIDHEEREDEFNERNNDPMDENNFDEREEVPRNNG
ncbi:hypothetical protein [Oceanobacillus sp. CFH 90083]|uniref:hypothetical protein n=1 Tax=Oceanobacillus sp. CFH 90083 TaxID=2592336 RepID=UPI00128CCDC9|nr:hypothetical protein [Oceanobacillus sp. CFH 90083]